MPDANGRETVEEYLARGGKITQVPIGKTMSADDLSKNKRKRAPHEGLELSKHIHNDIMLQQIENSLEDDEP